MRSRPRHPRRSGTLAVLLALACAAGLAVATPAGARTYFVSGHQLPGNATTLVMRGGLLGTWTGTVPGILTPIPQLPLLYQAIGTERFDGCLNRHRDWSCR